MKIKSLAEISKAIKSINFDFEPDLLVGIANGGIVPTYLLYSFLQKNFEFIFINFRNEKHQAVGLVPKLTKPLNFDTKNKKILLIDDRSNSGATFVFAKSLLKDAQLIKTFVINGKADYFLFDEPCFLMPWDIKK